MFLLLFFEFLQQVVQGREALVPGSFVVLDPVVDRLERPANQPVHPMPPFVADVHQAHFPQDAQVLGHEWLRQIEKRDKVVHGALPCGKEIQDLAPARLGYSVECVCCCCRSCHIVIIYPYGNMSMVSLNIGSCCR